ncbi:HepT-like ribonuclease domain-containing protein [Bryocella elongata]|nr:HepT-like ribonuclease domain-containing protein [Bryocella elongata]
MGNILRHAYDRIEEETIWNTIQDDLPPLKQAVALALTTHFPTADSQ